MGSIIFFFLIVSTSCKKDQPVQVPATVGFSWKFHDVLYQSNIDTLFASPGSVREYIMIGGTGLSVGNYMMGPRFDFNSLEPGTYNFTTEISDGGVIMNYTHITGEIYDALSGTLTIKSKTANKISGSFSGTLYNGIGNEQISGDFNEVPIQN